MKNLPIINNSQWILEDKDFYSHKNGVGLEVVAYMHVFDTKGKSFLNKTIHQYSIDARAEGINLRWVGNPFNMKNCLGENE